jgi:hypothetical protein
MDLDPTNLGDADPIGERFMSGGQNLAKTFCSKSGWFSLKWAQCY